VFRNESGNEMETTRLFLKNKSFRLGARSGERGKKKGKGFVPKRLANVTGIRWGSLLVVLKAQYIRAMQISS